MSDKFSLDQKISSCAACGLTQVEFIEDAGPYVEVPVHNLNLLLLTDPERNNYYNKDANMRQSMGVFPQVSNQSDNTPLYHLHPQFVVIIIIFLI